MRRRLFLFIAFLGLVFAAVGIWRGSLETELRIARAQRELPRPNDAPFYRCADSYYWVSYAQEMVKQHTLRVRTTTLDNAPYGRPNWGWAALNSWYLIILGKAWALLSGNSLGKALPPAALWSNPLLYMLALCAMLLFGLTNRNLAAAAGAILVFALSPRIYDDFAYATPGHHGWHDLACFGTLLCLAAGIRKRNSPPWFAAAGLAAAVAVWIGATQQIFGLAAAGAGALLAMLAGRRGSFASEDQGVKIFPASSWRIFGATAATAALFFYLLEYAPGSLAMRLEINHPLYAFAFLCGGEFLCRAQRSLLRAPSQGDLLWLALTGGALLATAGAIFCGPAEWHAMRTPLMQRLHHEIAEFQPVTSWYGKDCWLVLATPLLFVAAAIHRLTSARLTTRARMALFVCAFPTLAAIGLSFLQLRWAGIAGACAAALAAVLFADLPAAGQSRDGADAVANASRALLLPALCVCFSLGAAICWNVRHPRASAGAVRAQLLDRMATMELASLLAPDGSAAPAIAAFADERERQAWIGFATGTRSVGSLYWDNPDGVRDEAAFFSDHEEATAHEIARRRGITCVVVAPNPAIIVAYEYIGHGSEEVTQARKTLAYRLAAPRPDPPRWLKLLPSAGPASARENIRVYQVL